jgi:hypothetical protein
MWCWGLLCLVRLGPWQYNGIGLQTVRGTATNGYVVRNLSYVKPIMVRSKTGKFGEDWGSAQPKQRKACDEILEHDRKREVELKALELRESLEDKGYVPHVAVTACRGRQGSSPTTCWCFVLF